MFAVDQGIDLDYQVVDLFTGEHLKPEYAKINPNCMVPVLEDGDFRLTECSAILKYLADKAGSPAYPKDLKERARVNEMMDWFNSNIYKDFGYGVDLPADVPASQAAGRRGAGRNARVGQAEDPGVAEDPRPEPDRPEQDLSVRRQDHAGRLHGRRDDRAGRADRLQLSPPIRTSSAGSAT